MDSVLLEKLCTRCAVLLSLSVQVCTQISCSVLGRLLDWLGIVTDSPLISVVSAGSHSLEGNPPSFIEHGANGAEKLWDFLRCLVLYLPLPEVKAVSL